MSKTTDKKKTGWFIEGGPLTGYHVMREGDENAYTFFNMWDAIAKRDELNGKGQ